jgi:hypothetical protein
MRNLILIATTLMAISTLRAAEPDEMFVYENVAGSTRNAFVIGPSNMPSGARYTLSEKGGIECIRLSYVGDHDFRDDQPGALNIVHCWLFEGNDGAGKKLQFLFGKEPLTNSNTYPIYYKVGDQGRFIPWLKNSGMSRRRGELTDHVLAIFFQNQVDPTIFPTGPFNPKELDPIYPILAWDKCRPSLEKSLQSRLQSPDALSLPLVLTKISDGVCRFRIPQQTAIVQQAISQATGFPRDAFVRMTQTQRAIPVVESQIRNTYKPQNQVDLRLVGNGFREILEDDSNLLDQYRFSADTRLSDGRVTTTSKPWQRLNYPDSKNAHYWRIKFAMKRAGENKWDVYGYVEIGKRPLSEPDRDDRIRWITNTEDSPLYSNLSASANLGSSRTSMKFQTSYRIVHLQGEEASGEVIDARQESNLSKLLEEVFNLCKRKILND